jgi:hypothetical protein
LEAEGGLEVVVVVDGGVALEVGVVRSGGRGRREGERKWRRRRECQGGCSGGSVGRNLERGRCGGEMRSYM